MVSTTALDDSPTTAALPEGAFAPSLLGTPAGELVLRMTTGPHVGRVVRLSAAKCTIGSSADCTLRLRGRGIEPLHCLILRGTKQTVVRRWSSDTRLNDRPFDDAPLNGGDRLSVGPLEFQVLAFPDRSRDSAEAKPRRPEVELTAALQRIERLTERLELSNRQGRRRLRAVIARLRKYQLRLNDLEGRRSQLAQEREQLQAERTRLTEQTAEVQRRSLETQRQAEDAADRTVARYEQAARALEAREAELVARTKSLDERLATIEAGSRKLAEREAELTTRGELLHRQAAECERRAAAAATTAAELQAREDRLTAENAELQSQRERFAAELADLQSRESRLTAQAAELKSQQDRWDGEAVDLKSQRDRLAADVADLQRRETALIAATQELQRNESEVAARCGALKNHWAELIERETRLERDREAWEVRLREAAEAPPPVIRAEPQEDKQAAEKVEETRRQLEQERDALTQLRNECEQRQVALEERQAELIGRRETLELAARVLDCRARLLAADEVELAERAAAQPVVPSPETIVDTEPKDDLEQTVADRLRIEHLEAQLQTWRDEAKHWKHQFDELQLRDTLKGAAPTIAAEPEAVEPEPVAEPEVVETDAASPVDLEPTADAAADVVDEVPADEPVEATRDEVVAEKPAVPQQAESAADVLRRLGLTPDLDGEAPAPAPPPPVRPMPKPAAAEHHEQDESLDDYMQQLFQRLGVNQGSTPAAAAPSTPTASRSSVAESRVEAEPEQPAAPAAPIVPLTAEEFKARSVAAESKCDLSALRALANVNAKAAIAKHQVKTQSSKSKWKLMTALGSLGIAAVSAWAYLVQELPWGRYGIIAGLVVTVMSVLQSFRFKYGASKSARSLDDVLQKSNGRPAKEATE